MVRNAFLYKNFVILFKKKEFTIKLEFQLLSIVTSGGIKLRAEKPTGLWIGPVKKLEFVLKFKIISM